MKMPHNHTEAEVVEIIDRVAQKIASKFKFGYHDIDDMRQQARLFALEGLARYDCKRPLENFLWVHVHNRLFNFKRDNYERPSCPCTGCPSQDLSLKNGCVAHTDKSECLPFICWFNRNSSKKNLMRPVELEVVCDDYESRSHQKDVIVEDSILLEITAIIDRHLPVAMRADYIKMKYSLKLPKYKKTIIQEAIVKILSEHGYVEGTDGSEGG